MNKPKIIYVCLFSLLFAFAAFSFLKIKHHEEFKQKALLAQETRKALEHLMLDLAQARESTILDLPADGEWHNRIAFDSMRQGSMEYTIKDGQLIRSNKGQDILIADNIDNFRIRRQKETSDIIEVQIEAKKNISLISNLKIKVRQ